MSAATKLYRVYCFDLSEKAVTADFLRAADDDEAVSKAGEGCTASKCEIWEGRRLVAQLEGQREAG